MTLQLQAKIRRKKTLLAFWLAFHHSLEYVIDNIFALVYYQYFKPRFHVSVLNTRHVKERTRKKVSMALPGFLCFRFPLWDVQ